MPIRFRAMHRLVLYRLHAAKISAEGGARKNKEKKGGRQDSAIKSDRINRAGERASKRTSRRGRERTRVCGRSLFRDDRREVCLFSRYRP